MILGYRQSYCRMMLEVTTADSHSGTQTLGEVHHRLVDVFL